MTRFRMSILFRLSQLLAWVLVVALITSTLTATLFDPRPYLNAMKERNFYLALQGTVGALADKGFEGVPDQERAKIVTAVTESLSVQWIEEQVTMSLEAFLGFVQGRSDQFEARISLSEPKRTLAERSKPISRPRPERGWPTISSNCPTSTTWLPARLERLRSVCGVSPVLSPGSRHWPWEARQSWYSSSGS